MQIEGPTCTTSRSWWKEELCQLVKDCRACPAQGLDNDSNWSDFLRICKEPKQIIREKRKICTEEIMANVTNNYRTNIKAYWKFVNGSIKSSVKNRIETLADSNGNSFSSHAGKVKILRLHHEKLHSELYRNTLMIHGRRKS